MSTSLLLGDIEKAFLQIGVKEEDRDAFRFLFNIKGTEKHLRFTLIPTFPTGSHSAASL